MTGILFGSAGNNENIVGVDAGRKDNIGAPQFISPNNIRFIAAGQVVPSITFLIIGTFYIFKIPIAADGRNADIL